MQIGKIYQPNIYTSKEKYDIIVKIKSDYGNSFILNLKIKSKAYLIDKPNVKTDINIDRNITIPKNREFISFSKYENLIGKKISKYVKTNKSLEIFIPTYDKESRQCYVACLKIILELKGQREVLTINFEWSE